MPDPLLDRPPWAPRWIPDVDDERSIRWLRRVVVALLVAGFLAFVARGADGPADPYVEPVASTATTSAG